jgi:3-isopropylmalate/(R)-2-methylmalate dehydratase large subunit
VGNRGDSKASPGNGVSDKSSFAFYHQETTMGMTLAEKLLAHCAGFTSVRPGKIVMAKVDCAMLNDGLGPWTMAEGHKALGGRIKYPETVVVISDHGTPPANAAQAETVAFTRRWANEHGLCYYEGEGPCHQVLAENGRALPGTLMVGTDSHTCTAGAFGCFGTGIGSTEMIGVLITGEIWLKVPESISIVWNGTLPRGITAKDMFLCVLKKLGHAGATYKALEFSGETVKGLPVDDRMVLSNMSVEAGAKTGLIAPDDVTGNFFHSLGIRKPYISFQPDADAVYERTLVFDAACLVPQAASPNEVDNVSDVSSIGRVKIDQAYIGGCTGGRLADLRIAAEVLTGKAAAPGCRLLVSPASKKVFRDALKAGIVETLAAAGAVFLAPTCGACVGMHSGILARGEVCVSATNRNFYGRMGSYESKIYLASPATVAASAVSGYITDPRIYLEN